MARLFATAGRVAATVLLLLMLVAIGKVVQYAAVEAFAPRVGFDVPSLGALTLYAGGLLWLHRRVPARIRATLFLRRA